MTTMCALLGGLPLMLGTGTGSELRQPLGYAMVGGLVVSQVLTLFTTPVIYIYMDRLSHLGAWIRQTTDNARGSRSVSVPAANTKRVVPRDADASDHCLRAGEVHSARTPEAGSATHWCSEGYQLGGQCVSS